MTVFDKIDWIYEPAPVRFIVFSVFVSVYALGFLDEVFLWGLVFFFAPPKSNISYLSI